MNFIRNNGYFILMGAVLFVVGAYGLSREEVIPPSIVEQRAIYTGGEGETIWTEGQHLYEDPQRETMFVQRVHIPKVNR